MRDRTLAKDFRQSAEPHIRAYAKKLTNKTRYCQGRTSIPVPSSDSKPRLPSTIPIETHFFIERLHRHFLEVVKVELDRASTEDTNNLQALIFYNIRQEELMVGELTNRGYYLGSNLSHKVKKMVENGYLENEYSSHDRRSVRLPLSPKGLDVFVRMSETFTRQISALNYSAISEVGLNDVIKQLHTLEQFRTR